MTLFARWECQPIDGTLVCRHCGRVLPADNAHRDCRKLRALKPRLPEVKPPLPMRPRDVRRRIRESRARLAAELVRRIRATHKPGRHRLLAQSELVAVELATTGKLDGQTCSRGVWNAIRDILDPALWRSDWGKPPAAAAGVTPLPIDCLIAGTDRGIVTGATSIHWPCLGALAIGAARNQVGLAVADHGLTDAQRYELERVGVRWIHHKRPGLDHADVRPETIAALNAWWKPWICLASPFARSIWVDADAVVTGDLSPGFDLLDKGPWISTQHRFFGGGEALYRSMVDYLFGGDEHLLRSFSMVNTGVLGWAAGEPTIADWAAASEALLADMEALKRCTVRDQSAYVAMLCRRARGQQRLPTLLHDDRWNWPADGLASTRIAQRLPVSPAPEELLQEATERNPGAVVVHWLGRPKPWELARRQ